MRVTVYREAHFNAAHRLYRKDWSDAKNQNIFGKCSYPHYHGHNYDLEVGVTGTPDPETGFVINLDILKTIIKEEVEDYFDHKNLNIDIPEFENTVPSAENIAILIWNRIRKVLHPDLDLKIRLYETRRNFVEYDGN
ncbi:MAG: 6-carboxytetrahydropterin synthase [Weeksellaceae bacterium]|nr:6-carboxytetrahydropterin synthase [Weeksellaceae bacterium]